MAKKYEYKEVKKVTKKIIGVYDATNSTITVDGEERNILEELKDFSGEDVTITITLQDDTNLADE